MSGMGAGDSIAAHLRREADKINDSKFEELATTDHDRIVKIATHEASIGKYLVNFRPTHIHFSDKDYRRLLSRNLSYSGFRTAFDEENGWIQVTW